MKIFEYIFKIISRLGIIAIVIAIFSIASTPFQTVVLAILILIYLTIVTFMDLWKKSQIAFAEALDVEFEIIKRTLAHAEGFKERVKTKGYEDFVNTIDAICIFVTFLIIVYHLFAVIW